jgi:DNA-binding beta-propeller fold protein YncE
VIASPDPGTGTVLAPTDGSSGTAVRRSLRQDRGIGTRRVVAIAVTLVAVGCASTRPNGPTGPTSTTTTAAPAGLGITSSGTVTRFRDSGGTGVAASPDAIWTTADHVTRPDGSGVPRQAVDRRDPQRGAVTAIIPMPGAVREVAVGAGLVWALGGGDGAFPQGGVAAIDPATNRVVFSYGWDARPRFAPYRIAFSRDAAWVTDTAGRVLRFEPTTTGVAVASSPPLGGQATDIVVLSDGSVWVRLDLTERIAHIDPVTLQVTATRPWAGSLFAADADTIWTTDGDRLIQLNPSALASGVSVAEGARLPVHATAVAVDTDGIWVAMQDGGMARYDRAALGDPQARWNAEIPTGPVTAPWSLAPQGHAAWFIDNQGLVRWVLP